MPDSPDPPYEQLPHRELRDPQALRAIAHPVRLRILEELASSGPATATELSERVEESPANCSWHLRQLARYGFIEEAEGGTGRQRPWQVIPQSHSFGEEDEPDPELARAEDLASEVLLGREVQALSAWRAGRRADSPAWREASFTTHSWGWLTADELAALRDEVGSLLERHLLPHLDRIDPARRPPGCRPVRLVAWAVPRPPHTETPAADGTEPPDPDGPTVNEEDPRL